MLRVARSVLQIIDGIFLFVELGIETEDRVVILGVIDVYFIWSNPDDWAGVAFMDEAHLPFPAASDHDMIVEFVQLTECSKIWARYMRKGMKI